MEIIYKNTFGELISEIQTHDIDEFSKVYRLNGITRKEEEFSKGDLVTLIHYLQPSETHQQVVSSQFIPGKELVIRETQTVWNGFTLEKDFNYNIAGIFMTRSNNFYDLNQNLIGYEWIKDIATGIPKFKMTRKFFYDRAVNPEEYLFDVSFNEDGSLNEIYYNNHHIDPDDQESIVFSNTPADIQELRSLTGISQQLADYYVNPNVVP